VLSAILILLILGVALAVLLWVGAAVIQGYIYSEPPPDLYWRAPAAALALSLFVAFWCILANRFPGKIGTLNEFVAGSQKEEFPVLVWVRPDPADNQRFIDVQRYTYNKGKKTYLDDSGKPWTRSTSDGIVEWLRGERKEGDETVTALFKADLKPDGTFKTPTIYIEQGGKGRVMTDEDLGHVSTPRQGLVFANLFLNAAFFGAWFLCLWLLLRFQWPHALGLAVPLWAALTLTIVPMLLTRSGG
jgi:hypothetical protein